VVPVEPAAMSIHICHRELWIPRPRPEVFDFFSEARNLERITPPWLNFRVLTPGSILMGEGTLIRYKLRIRGLPARWLTEITRWDPPYEFADIQRSGPYKMWDHTHTFEEENGGTRMTDEVRYELPLGPLGDLIHSLLVRRDVETIFDYRNNWIARHFSPVVSP
jgi:ligand-binding SRPBCC domain-containing protein